MNKRSPVISLSSAIAMLVAFWGLSMEGGMAARQAKSSPQEEVEKLLMTVRDFRLQETDPDRVIKAIERLGDLRDPAAAEDLAQLLTFKRIWPWEKDPTVGKTTEPVNPTTWNTYPAVKALSLIGEPSLPSLIRVITSHESTSLENEKALEVIILISRYKRAEYVSRLQYEAGTAPNSESAERLRMAAQKLKESKR